MNVYNRSESFVRFVNMKKSPFKTAASMTFTALDNMLSMEPYYSFPHPHPRCQKGWIFFLTESSHAPGHVGIKGEHDREAEGADSG